MLAAYPNDVKLVLKHFPLSFHQNARPAAEAAEFAQEHGKFWEMHDLLFKNQRTLGMDSYKSFASQLGLDPAALEKAINSEAGKTRIEKDIADGRKANVTGTPTIYINGKKLQRRDFATIKQIIDGILASKKQAASGS